MHRPVRIGLIAAAVITLFMATAAPALAHGRGTDAGNYDSRITDVPAIDGVQWRVYGGDELLWAENRSDKALIVHGYEEEPYLRIDPDGVFENRNSEATYRNQERSAPVQVPESVDPSAPPEWVQVSTTPRYAWHDRRISANRGVGAPTTDHDERAEIMEWTVPFSFDGQDLELTGELVWVAGPAPWPWLVLGLILTLPALLGLRTRPVGGRWPGLARPAAAVLAVVVVANVTFVVDDLLAIPLPLTTTLVAAAQTALFLALGVFGAVRGWQAGNGAFTALGVGAGALFLGQGLLLWPVLTASQVSTVFPDVVARIVAGLNLMQIIPLGTVAFLGTRRLVPGPEKGAAEDAPAHAPD